MSTTKRQSGWRAVLDSARADDGMALALVTAISAVLFILATTLIVLASQQQVSAGKQLSRTKALHAADAGINAYLYKLSKTGDPVTYVNTTGNATLGPTATADGNWTVTAVFDPAKGVIILTSVGNVPSANVSRMVKAQVKPSGFSDYMFLFNESLPIGAGALIKGSVRSNKNITNDGEITGAAYAVGTITSPSGSGKFDGGRYPGWTSASFATVDFAKLKSIATTTGTYWGDVGTFGSYSSTPTLNTQRHYVGYHVVLTGTGGYWEKMKGINTTTGTMTVDAATRTNFDIPLPVGTQSNGVLYFDDAIWVEGQYSRKVTIVSGVDYESSSSDKNNIGSVQTATTPKTDMNATSTAQPPPQSINSSVFIASDITPVDQTSDSVCGIVTPGDISFPTEYASMPSTLDVWSAILSVNGSVHADMQSNKTKALVNFIGANASWDPGGMTSGNPATMGFVSRNYFYDYRLNMNPPPNYPPLGDGKLNVASWVEN
jgi:hypothetical protein